MKEWIKEHGLKAFLQGVFVIAVGAVLFIYI